jgi:ribosomal protein S18 acetylase RimI-like enzyme
VNLVAVGHDDAAALQEVRALFQEYQSQVDAEICFAGFTAELVGLPGEYAAPDGALLLAYVDAQAVGCVALRKVDASRGEMKRLFVSSAARGRGIGRALLDRVMQEARHIGYHELVLDTLPAMTEAQALYRAEGFVDIAPYATHPAPGTLCFGKPLT